jgi:hypothetical protein
MMYTPCMSNYYLYDFLEIIDNKKYRKVMLLMMVCISYMSRDIL